MKSSSLTKPIYWLNAASLVIGSLSFVCSLAALKADDIREWYGEREEMAAKPYLDPKAAVEAVAWASTQSLRIDVKTGLYVPWWMTIGGIGHPKASCTIRVTEAQRASFLLADGFSDVGSQKEACSQALTAMNLATANNVAQQVLWKSN